MSHTASRRSKLATAGEDVVLFQEFFKSVGLRTYAVQIKEARNGNHALVLIEGKRDDAGEVRKTRVFVWSEDFMAFFRLMQEAVQFIKANPVPEAVVAKRRRYWDRVRKEPGGANNNRR